MKPKKIFIATLTLTVLALTMPACKKSFLELTPQGIIPVTSYYKTEIDIKTALTGIYSSLKPIYNSQWAFGELPSDNSQTYAESEGSWGEEDKLTWTSSSTVIQTAWSRHYATIAYCNLLLDNIGGVSMAQTNKDNYIAQAKFVRSLMYFNLVRMFGGVPLVLKALTNEQDAYSYKRSTVAEIYTQIETDLNAAAAVLPASYTGTDIGRATSNAAKGLLGKVYLYQNKFTEAEAKLAEIINTAHSGIIPYDQVFGLGRDNNADIAFSIQYISGGYGEGNFYASQFVPQTSGTTIIGVSGNSFNSGTLDLYNAFDQVNDKRFPVAIAAFSAGNINYYYAKKFIYASVQFGNEGDNDWPVLRFSDIVLMYAEALNENGKVQLALNELNIIRSRSGLTAKTLTVSASDLTGQADARSAIRNERRVELCFEGERWFDLIRWNTFVTVMQAFKAKYSTTVIGSIGNILPTLNLYPIPIREINLNPNLTQNPGY